MDKKIKKFNENISVGKPLVKKRISLAGSDYDIDMVKEKPVVFKQQDGVVDLKQKEQNGINHYNMSCHDIDEDVESFTLLGQRVLVRPYKLNVISESGLYTPWKIEIPTDSGLQTKSKDHPFPYKETGVIVKVGTGCTDDFNENIKVGDIVCFNLPVNINTVLVVGALIGKMYDMTFDFDKDKRSEEQDFWTISLSQSQIVGKKESVAMFEEQYHNG